MLYEFKDTFSNPQSAAREEGRLGGRPGSMNPPEGTNLGDRIEIVDRSAAHTFPGIDWIEQSRALEISQVCWERIALEKVKIPAPQHAATYPSIGRQRWVATHIQ